MGGKGEESGKAGKAGKEDDDDELFFVRYPAKNVLKWYTAYTVIGLDSPANALGKAARSTRDGLLWEVASFLSPRNGRANLSPCDYLTSPPSV